VLAHLLRRRTGSVAGPVLLRALSTAWIVATTPLIG
jgi:hypothetical protein